MRPLSFTVRFTYVIKPTMPWVVRAALETTVEIWSTFRSLAMRFDDSALFVIPRACKAVWQASIVELPDVEGPEQTRELISSLNVKNNNISIAFHVHRLRGIGLLRETVWPPQRCHGWFIGDDTGYHIPPTMAETLLQERTQIDGDGGYTSMVGIKAMASIEDLTELRSGHDIKHIFPGMTSPRYGKFLVPELLSIVTTTYNHQIHDETGFLTERSLTISHLALQAAKTERSKLICTIISNVSHLLRFSLIEENACSIFILISYMY
ncbi:MAG: hypothetical protein Q9208_006958 [Pyrenodesmia sp. 3 TL-2023]